MDTEKTPLLNGCKNGKFNSIESVKDTNTIFSNGQTELKYKSRKPKKINEFKSISYIQLYRYATGWEKCLTLLGILFASLAAFGIPFNVILYGEYTTLLIDRSASHVGTGTSTATLLLWLFGGGRILTNATDEENRLALIDDSYAYGLGGLTFSVIQFIFCAIGIHLVNISALKQISRIRVLFLRAVLRQDMVWYDTSSGNNFASKITEDLDKLKEGISDKLAVFVYLLMTFVIGVVFSFIYGWKLTLVILSCAPIIIIATAFVAKMQSSLSEKELKSYSIAGSVAEEVFTNIRTVIAFGGEEKDAERYKERLRAAEVSGERKGFFTGIGGGTIWFINYCIFALAFWYGVELILADRYVYDKDYTPATLVIVLFGVLVGAQNLGLTSPHLEAFAMARGAAAGLFDIIDRRPTIDSFSEDGLRPEKITGEIEFKNVHFRYPARKDVVVLQGLNLSIPAGKTVALVGSSGCGKSTCLQLIQRLYDPDQGSVSVDGIDISQMNTSWMRSFIGVVGQEPVLFSTTIGENIRFGNPDVTQDEIERAAKIANCHDFIIKLTNGYDTMVGERGGQLSGGQKQRVAIARALVRNPKILLLDEATSALDPNSERLVQKALEKASEGRTTIVVSHRLSTITNADKIIFINKGLVEEEGTHTELMEAHGFYYDLVNASNANSDSNNHVKKRPGRVYKKSESVVSSLYSESVGEEEAGDDEFNEEDEEEVEAESKESDDDINAPMLRILKLNSPEWFYILVGCISAVIMGATFPVFAIIFGEFYGILDDPDEDAVRRESNTLSILFIVLALLAGLGTFFQTYMINIAGVRLTSRLRQNVFKSIIRQEIGWFDQATNSIGSLCTRLSSDCSSVQGATGSRIGSMLQAISTIVFGVSISMYLSWNLTLVAITSIPLVLAACFFESRYMRTSSLEEKKAIENGSKLAVEAIANIRTVASLGQERQILNRYTAELNRVEDACRRKIRYRGVVYSLGQATPSLAYAMAFTYGGILVANGEIPYKSVIKISEALIFGTWMLGNALAYAPNIGLAILSAGRLFQIIDRIPQYQNPPPLPYNEPLKTEGNIKFKDVTFNYPTRRDIQVLRGLDLNIHKGHTVALVGPSGCGKSTCIQLLLRYYDPATGRIELDGTPTTEFPLSVLRSQLGLVSQEPSLFDRTIAENIAYGDNSREIPMIEIIEAAKKANIHDFISSIPMGYDTNLGSNGAQLSGGQKQRVAIARALVRNPRILLLDEATSALDTQSESIVQAALDQARLGRTCITIAHRLQTIQNADQICVIQNGAIIEQGTHEELMQLGKAYSKLYKMQEVA